MNVSDPIGAVSFVAFISPLVGATGEDFSAPIVVVVDRILLLALQQHVEEVHFDVRKDQCLDVRLRRGNEWTALPPLNCTGSALSRLLVLGHLEKGEEAHSRPQTGRMEMYGVEMRVETEPVAPWRENIRVLIGHHQQARSSEREMVCSGCMTIAPESRIHVLPLFNEHVNGYVTVFRCERCWAPALAQTRSRLEATTDAAELISAADFFQRHGIFIPEHVKGSPADVYRERLLQILDGLQFGGLYLHEDWSPAGSAGI